VISASELEVSRIRELTRNRRHGEALAVAEALPDAAQTNVDILYLQVLNVPFQVL